jgi:hypothetical protein
MRLSWSLREVDVRQMEMLHLLSLTILVRDSVRRDSLHGPLERVLTQSHPPGPRDDANADLYLVCVSFLATMHKPLLAVQVRHSRRRKNRLC